MIDMLCYEWNFVSIN